MIKTPAILVLLALLAITPPALADTSLTYTPTPYTNPIPENITCPPNSFMYNITGSGAYICIPPLQQINTSLTNLVIIYNDTGAYILATTLEPNGANLTIRLSYPNGTMIKQYQTYLAEDNTTWLVTTGFNTTYSYIVVNITINGNYLGVYAVKKQLEKIGDISSLSSISPLIPILMSIAIFAPLIGIILRGDIKTGSIGAIAIAIIYTPLMTALGINPLVAGFISTLIIIMALIILALNPR
ncbi:MAG: hypothetical protein GXO43_06160 [Crenarchaeota archaeon]|nr:hypothetical protein [Thermoproteota archaeon]